VLILCSDDGTAEAHPVDDTEAAMVTAIVIPTIGGPHLGSCLDAVADLDPSPAVTVVVAAGAPSPPTPTGGVEVLSFPHRLGFADAMNAGLRRVVDHADRVAVLNDDAVPAPGWLAPLEAALDDDPSLAAVQGTVTDAGGAAVDGRGIALDATGLPIQIDRGLAPAPEPGGQRPVLAVSATAAVFHSEALRDSRLADGSTFDRRFGSYHEDLDLGLRLRRLGWHAAWVPGAWSSHLGSATGRGFAWRHPWWLLTNRWRALSGNLTAGALSASLPRLLRGELRAVRTLGRTNPRTWPVMAASTAAVPWLIVTGFLRSTPGARLRALPLDQP
jgi:GT2 family glycosyltransferase